MKRDELNRNLSIPLYVQLKEIILGDIQSGEIKPGEMIRTEFELMEDFGVSRNVVRQAIGDLVAGGYLIRKKAKGTFVSTPTANVERLATQEDFRKSVLKRGAIPLTKVLSMEVLDADEAVAELLGVERDARVIRIRRLHYSDDVPTSFSISYLPYAKCGFVLEHRLQTDSLRRVLGLRYDTRIYHATQRFEARIAREHEAEMLEIEPNSVVQCVTRQSYSRMDAVVEATISVYRGDFEISVETHEHH